MKLIDKSAIVDEIKSRIKESEKLADVAADNNLHNTLEANKLLIRQYTSLLSFLNTLEVKEVDLEKELNNIKRLEEKTERECKYFLIWTITGWLLAVLMFGVAIVK